GGVSGSVASAMPSGERLPSVGGCAGVLPRTVAISDEFLTVGSSASVAGRVQSAVRLPCDRSLPRLRSTVGQSYPGTAPAFVSSPLAALASCCWRRAEAMAFWSVDG